MYQTTRSQPVVPSNVSGVPASNSGFTTMAITACIGCRKRKLRCDRLKPKCGTCSRTKHECEFPNPVRKMASKKRSAKDIEARLAHIETRLNPKDAPSTKRAIVNNELSNSAVSSTWRGRSFPGPSANSAAETKFQSAIEENRRRKSNLEIPDKPAEAILDLLSLRLEESFPPESVQQDLFQIYFAQVHCYIPMTHRPRFLAALKLEFHQRPPKCLQYAMWALAASVSQKYNNFCNILYEKARECAIADELKAESSLTVYHAQSWHLIATFEAQKANLARSWISTGRCVRLVQMMGLQYVDDPRDEVKVLPKTQDPAELEERRRTFWAAYFGDRWVSAGSGWPMSISESEIFTRLPMSELVFESGTDETSPFLPETLVGDGASKLASPFAGLLLAATLFGRNFTHIHNKAKGDNPKDIKDGKFWSRHREFDNILSSTFMHLPEHLKLSGGLQDLRTLFLHMSLHASLISLHKAAVIVAVKYRLEPTLITRSVSRCIIAANEICNIMKTINHHDLTKMNPWTGCALYIAGRVYCHDIRVAGPTKLESSSNLEFLLSAMNTIMEQHSFIKPFTTQLASELRAARHAAVRQETGVIGEISTTSPKNTCYILSNSSSTSNDTSVNINETSKFEGNSFLSPLGSSSKPPLSGIFIEDNLDAKPCPYEQLAEHEIEQCPGLNKVGNTSFASRQDTLNSTEQQFNRNDSSSVRNSRIQNRAPTIAEFQRLPRSTPTQQEEDQTSRINDFRDMPNAEMPALYLPSNYSTTQHNFYATRDQRRNKRRADYDIWNFQHRLIYSVDQNRDTRIDGVIPDDYSMELDA